MFDLRIRIQNTICVFICVFAVLINKVSQQVTVEAVIGGSAVLPCSSTKHEHKRQDINVFWRHNGSKIVYDIIPSSNSLENQDPEYKNRTETFPEEYERGNFSIKLKDLTHADAGIYICYMTHSSEKPTVQLIISEKVTISTEQENQGGTEPDSEGTSWALICGVTVSAIIVIGVIVALWIKKSHSLRTDRHNMGSDAHEVEHMNQ